jgi:hypothetical protein
MTLRKVSPNMRYPHYYSTYCIHGLHDDCRLICKHCEEQCQCGCHRNMEDEDAEV